MQDNFVVQKIYACKKGILFGGLAFVGMLMIMGAGITAKAADYYISPNGSDSNKGTYESPYKSITKAQQAASSGDTV